MKKERLQNYINEFQNIFLGEEFIWRRGQKEAIEQIIEAYFNPKCNTVILDAPVGSGKSIIAMTTAWILNQESEKGYILSSDISLQDQYENDLKYFNISWGSVKGLDNYICVDNDEKTPLGTCKLKRRKPISMHCYDDCPYYTARDKAAGSPTSMLNYAYWLTMMNDVNPRLPENKHIFPKRDFTICDEAHKILDIIQNSYSPRFSEKTTKNLEKLADFFFSHNVSDLHSVLASIKKSIEDIRFEDNQDILLEILSKIVFDIGNYKNPINLLKERVGKEYHEKPPKEWRQALWLSDWVLDLYKRLHSYVDIISKTSTRNLIKNPNREEIVFNCLEERYLMHKYFHGHTGFRILMSATFSDPSEYIKGIALSGAKYIKLESQFNFDKSPIYYYNEKKMSYNHIESNLPWLIKKVNEIIDNHKNEAGLIHSASYDLSMKIYNGLNKKAQNRVLIYNGTEEKRNFLEDVKLAKDKIIMGPSLLEGLDMKDDFARFQIFAKVPYLSLGDTFVKTKMNIDPSWYQWKAAMALLQGIGRIVRNENDWGITYILDASLSDLIHRNRKIFSSDFYKRLKVIKE